MAATRHRRADPSGAATQPIADAIAKHFEGDAALYDAFAASCRQQFVLDAAAGQDACRAGDLNALRRLCHDLKSVLIVLGLTALSALAAQVEHRASAGESVAACEGWRQLRGALLRWRVTPRHRRPAR